MKRIILACLLIATPALAQPAPQQPAPPPTFLLPTSVVNELGQYLAGRPYGEVDRLMQDMQQCIALQMRKDSGVMVSHGECPAVVQAMTGAAKADAKKAAPAPVAALK